MTPLSSLARRLFPLIEGLFPLLFSRLHPVNPAAPVLAALHNYFRRVLARFDRLAHAWETNSIAAPKPRKPREKKTDQQARPRLRFSTKNGWLLDQFPFAERYKAALFNYRLQMILDDPEVKALFAAIPRAAGTLRLMAKLLAVPLPLPKRPRKPRPKQPKPERPTPHRSSDPPHLRAKIAGIDFPLPRKWRDAKPR